MALSEPDKQRLADEIDETLADALNTELNDVLSPEELGVATQEIQNVQRLKTIQSRKPITPDAPSSLARDPEDEGQTPKEPPNIPEEASEEVPTISEPAPPPAAVEEEESEEESEEAGQEAPEAPDQNQAPPLKNFDEPSEPNEPESETAPGETEQRTQTASGNRARVQQIQKQLSEEGRLYERRVQNLQQDIKEDQKKIKELEREISLAQLNKALTNARYFLWITILAIILIILVFLFWIVITIPWIGAVARSIGMAFFNWGRKRHKLQTEINTNKKRIEGLKEKIRGPQTEIKNQTEQFNRRRQELEQTVGQLQSGG